MYCLKHYSVAERRHHDQGNSYKRKHLIGGLLTLSDVQSIIIMVRNKVAHMKAMVLKKQLRSLQPDLQAAGTARDCFSWDFEILKITPVTYSSNKAIPPNPFNPFMEFHSLLTKNLLCMSLQKPFLFKSPHVYTRFYSFKYFLMNVVFNTF